MKTSATEAAAGPSNASIRPLAPPRLFRYVEAGALVCCTALNLWLAHEIILGLAHREPNWWWLVAAMFGAYLLADLLTGLVHFLGDSFGSVDTPVLGLTFVLPFRSHHAQPGDICEHDFVATNGNNAFATLLLVGPLLFFSPLRQGGGWAVVGAFALVLSLSLMLTNQIHKWAHVSHPPPLVRPLQRLGVLLSPERHESHHRPPYVGGYCVTSGLCNRLLDPIGFFPFLERVIRASLRLHSDKAPRTTT